MKLWHKLTILWILVALLYLLWGASIIIKGASYENVKSTTAPMRIVVLLLIFVSVFTTAKDKGLLEYKSMHDERTKKISGRAFTYSWLATFLFVCILAGLDAFNLLTITVSQVLTIIFFFMFLGSIMIHWYYDKKSDVE
jgi:hypothetical protein